jgi:hypothetical protein
MTFGLMTKAVAALKQTTGSFFHNSSGNVSVIMAAVAVPLLGAAGLAIDFNRSVTATNALQDLADRAALYGVSSKGTLAQKEAASALFLDKNKVALPGVSYTAAPKAEKDSMGIAIETQIEGTLMPILLGSAADGTWSLPVRSRAKKIMGGDVCLLALGESEPVGIQFSSGGGYFSDTCGAHSNSTSPSAIQNSSIGDSEAAFFHTPGGGQLTSSGTITPAVEGSMPKIEDPLAASLNVTCPNANSAVDVINSGATDMTLSETAYKDILFSGSGSGTFTKKEVYVFGVVQFSSLGDFIARDSTIILCGPDAELRLTSTGKMEIGAPTTGRYAGLAVIGTAENTKPNSFSSNGNGYIRGVWYTPATALNLSSEGDFNTTTSNYSPIIVKSLQISGNGKVKIGLNNEQPDPNSTDPSKAYPSLSGGGGVGEGVYLTQY